jgi:hypothetical protein
MADFTRKEIQQMIAISNNGLNLHGANLQNVDLHGLFLK